MTSRTLDFISHFSHTALNAMRPLVDEGPHYQHYPVHLSKEWGSPYVQSPACLTFSLYHNSKCFLYNEFFRPGAGLKYPQLYGYNGSTSIHHYICLSVTYAIVGGYAGQPPAALASSLSTVYPSPLKRKER